MKTFSRKLVWRLGWLTVLLLHIPATFKLMGVGSSDDSLSTFSATFIALSNIFFVFEIAFCPILALCASKRRMMIFFLIVALLHAGALHDAMQWGWDTSPLQALAFVLGFACVALAFSNVRRSRFSIHLQRAQAAFHTLVPQRPDSHWLSNPANAPPLL